MRLYTYWRSQASYRVRIALRLKGLDAEMVSLDLLKGEQFATGYRILNPEGVVPTLIDGDGPPLRQSLAIIEYLDERYPDPPLLPGEIRARAHVRALAQLVASDAHPFIVPRVRKYLEGELGVAEAGRSGWIRHWLDQGTQSMEQMLVQDPRTGRFCCGDSPTLADIGLVAHVASAFLFYDCNLGPHSTVQRIFDECMQLDAFSSTHPWRQPDAPAHAGSATTR
jgi:maleylacetoacetate isomerase